MKWPKTTSTLASGEGDQRERNEQECAATALPEGPAVHRKIVGAANAFHQSREDAGGSDEADEEGDDEGVGRLGAVWRINEVAFEKRADVGRKDAIEEGGELEAKRGGIGQETDDCGCDDERGKERHHCGVGGGLGEIETVVPSGAKQSALENSGKAQESSHEIYPRFRRRPN